MASPQLQKGHTRIANEILEQISKTDLNGTQFRLLTVIWRYTYGFSRKEYEIPLSFLAEAIDSKKAHVSRELTALIDRGIIKSNGIGKRRGRVLSFNKNYEEWDQPTGQLEAPKELKKKAQKKQKYSEDNTYYKMAVYFHSKVTLVAKEVGLEHLIIKANLQSYADEFRKLIELDKVDKHLAKEVMDWVTQDSFWRSNVLSAKKLREKFTELAIKMKNSNKPNVPKQVQQADPRDKEIAFQRWIENGGDPDEFNWRE
ncbi:replication protein [Cytobacillus solani]|uniref:replication protein n=1 Tax=Cytobacillus solani TaxID=1637975 RepID=UPI002079361A|nr:replication protein [Cytobacillus solani]USK54390.1 replication protein [Cytobacillus solani]